MRDDMLTAIGVIAAVLGLGIVTVFGLSPPEVNRVTILKQHPKGCGHWVFTRVGSTGQVFSGPCDGNLLEEKPSLNTWIGSY